MQSLASASTLKRFLNDFSDEGVDKNYDYLEGVYELFNLTRDQDISLPGENLPESLQDYWAIIETIIAGTGAKGIGLDLNEYGEEIVKPAACQQILCRNFIEYVEVKVIAKDVNIFQIFIGSARRYPRETVTYLISLNFV